MSRSIFTHISPSLNMLLSIMAGGGLLVGFALTVGCGSSAAHHSTNTTPTVHMSLANFTQGVVTVPKGAKLRLVADVPISHLLENGIWNETMPQPTTEPGAPVVKDLHISQGAVEIGPFNTSGTFHIFCTVHPGMTLTIIVP